MITNTSGAAVSLQSPCISIDNGKKLYWGDFTLEAGKTVTCHVFHSNVQYLTPGLHTAEIFASGEPVYSGRFSIGRAWSEIFTFPTEAQMAARSADERSPYICTWLTGNTTVEQWFQDLATEKWTHICTYDTGVKNSGFIGDMALFSENFLSQYAGGVRSLEFTNVRIHTSEGWRDVNSSYYTNIQTSDIHENAYGSWEAGADQNSFYMISTGVPGWGRTEKIDALSIRNQESGNPCGK